VIETDTRRERMTMLRKRANLLRETLIEVGIEDAEFVKVFNFTLRSDKGYQQFHADLEALAGLARMEE
jgi:hypothetical protein